MLCSRCGALIVSKSAKFCPKCGYELNSYSIPIHKRHVPETGYAPASSAYTAPPVKKKSNTKAIAAIVVAAVVAVSVLSFVDLSETEKTEKQMITDDTYFILSGGFLTENDTLSANMAVGGKAEFSLVRVEESQYSSYTWKLNKLRDATGQITNTTTKSGFTPEFDLKPGTYSVSVLCYNSISDNKTYSGKITYVGIVVEKYNWVFKGTNYSAEVTFNYEKYLEYKNMDKRGRSPYNYTKVTSFVTYDDPVVRDLSDSLRSAYGSGAVLDQDYAAFILGFVQIVFVYYSDNDLYGQEEYFAYPLEVITHRGGDCEDTAIFAAALFKAAGFDAGVIMIPGHAVAAVGLDDYDPGYYQTKYFEVLSQMVDGITYYACETTADWFLQVGLVDSEGYEGKPYSWHLENSGNKGYKTYVV